MTTAVLAWLLVTLVQSQTGVWFVLPVATESAPWIEPTAEGLSRELARRGVRVWSTGDAAAAFEERGSAPATALDYDALARWVAWSRIALRNLARGNYAAARHALNQSRRLSREATEELNERKAESNMLLDSCLYMVRALLDAGSEEQARRKATECAERVPRGQPKSVMHPPPVLTLYQQASRAQAQGGGALSIKSQPSGCAAYVNGVEWGRTPLRMEDLLAGEYAVQVSCIEGEPGRVHSVRVAPGVAQASIDTRFDRKVRTEPSLHLRYTSNPSRLQQTADALEVARTLPAAAVVLVNAVNPEMLDLELMDRSGHRRACAQLPVGARGPSQDAVRTAVETLLSGDCPNLIGKRIPGTSGAPSSGLMVNGEPTALVYPP